MSVLDWEKGELAAGLECYRRQLFFETHEHWERVWLEAPEPEKSFLQSLIQIAVSFHHFQRGNFLGSERMLARSLRKLDKYPPTFSGIDVRILRLQAAEWLQALKNPSRPVTLPFPPINRVPLF